MSYHTQTTEPRTPFTFSKKMDEMDLPLQVNYLTSYIKLLKNFDFNARYNAHKKSKNKPLTEAEERKLMIEILNKDQQLEKLISMAAFLKIPLD